MLYFRSTLSVRTFNPSKDPETYTDKKIRGWGSCTLSQPFPVSRGSFPCVLSMNTRKRASACREPEPWIFRTFQSFLSCVNQCKATWKLKNDHNIAKSQPKKIRTVEKQLGSSCELFPKTKTGSERTEQIYLSCSFLSRRIKGGDGETNPIY